MMFLSIMFFILTTISLGGLAFALILLDDMKSNRFTNFIKMLDKTKLDLRGYDDFKLLVNHGRKYKIEDTDLRATHKEMKEEGLL